MKGAANTCPTVDSLYKNLLHPGVFDTVVVFKRSPPLCRQILSIETVQALPEESVPRCSYCCFIRYFLLSLVTVYFAKIFSASA